MRRRLTFAELVMVVGLLYFAVTIMLGATYLGSGWSWRVVAPDGWYSPARLRRSRSLRREDLAAPAPHGPARAVAGNRQWRTTAGARYSDGPTGQQPLPGRDSIDRGASST